MLTIPFNPTIQKKNNSLDIQVVDMGLCSGGYIPPLTLPLVAMAETERPVTPVMQEETRMMTQVRPKERRWRWGRAGERTCNQSSVISQPRCQVLDFRLLWH